MKINFTITDADAEELIKEYFLPAFDELLAAQAAAEVKWLDSQTNEIAREL